MVQGRLLENSLILFDEKGLFGLFGVLVNLFEEVIILFFTESGVKSLLWVYFWKAECFFFFFNVFET